MRRVRREEEGGEGRVGFCVGGEGGKRESGGSGVRAGDLPERKKRRKRRRRRRRRVMMMMMMMMTRRMKRKRRRRRRTGRKRRKNKSIFVFE